MSEMKILFDISRENQIFLEEHCQKNSLSFGDWLAQAIEQQRSGLKEEKKPKKTRRTKNAAN